MKEPKKTLDSTLLQQARDGDREARSALYEATYQEVWRTVRSLIRSEDDALDVLQDTYVRAFTRLDQLKNPASVGPWLRTIAANTARSHLQKTKPLLFSDLGEDAGELPEPPVTDTAALPEASLDQKETAALLRELLDSLSDGQRLVLSLHYYEDMPVREIARSLDVTESTVKTQLRDGRKRLEQKVRDLERRGVNLYGLSALPLFRTLMQKNAETLTPPRTAAIEAALPAETAAIRSVTAGGLLVRRLALGAAILAAAVGIGFGGWRLMKHKQGSAPAPTQPFDTVIPAPVRGDSDQDSVVIDEKQSFFRDFEVLEDRVVFRCHYVLRNQTDDALQICLQGDFEKEYLLGSTKEKALYAQTSAEDPTDVFVVSPGETVLDVCYVGTFNGTKQKANRLLPPTTVFLIGPETADPPQSDPETEPPLPEEPTAEHVELPTVMNLPGKAFIGESKEFTKAGLTISLSDKFAELESEQGFDAYYSSDYCGVVVLKEPFSLEEGLAEKSLVQYVSDVIENNGHTDLHPLETDGLIYFEFTRDGLNVWSCSYKGSDAFYIVQFLCRGADREKLKDLIFFFAKSVEVE